jgi:hypothetical protein
MRYQIEPPPADAHKALVTQMRTTNALGPLLSAAEFREALIASSPTDFSTAQ